MLDLSSAAPRSARRTSLSLALISALIAAPLALVPVSFASADEGGETAVVAPVAPAEVEPVVTEPVVEMPPVTVAATPVAEAPAEEAAPAAAQAPAEAQETAVSPSAAAPEARIAQAAIAAPTFTASTNNDSVTFTWAHDPALSDPRLEVQSSTVAGEWQPFVTFYAPDVTATASYPKHVPVTFRARTTNELGTTSDWSTTGSLIVGTAPGEVPNLRLDPTSGGLVLLWMYPSEGSGDMVVDVQYRTSTVDDSAAWISAPANAWQLTGLAGETQYDVRVRGTNPVGSSAWTTASATTLAATPPTVPTSVSAASSLGSVSILWSAPAVAGSSPVTSYEWAWKLHSQTDAEWTQVSATSSPGTRFASGVPQLHDLRVRAVNAGGPGPWSATVSATPQTIFIPPMFPVAPGAATNLVLTAGDTTIDASWTAATGTVTSYSVVVTAPGETARTFSSTATSLEITGLTNSTQYLVTVTPYNQYVAGTAASEHGTPYVFAPVFTLADGSPATGAKLRAGDKVTISGVGALPLMTVYAELRSDPIALGNVMTESDGSFSLTVTIPRSAPSGSHSLFVYLAGDGGSVADSAISVTIPALTAVADAVDGGGTLAITGADPATALWLALAALLTGIAFTALSRRRTA